VAKKISVPQVYLAQTMHLSDAEINSVSKQTKASFHLNHVTYEFHRVCPKRFLSQLDVQCKLCIYLASRLTLLQFNRSELSIDLCHLGVPSSTPKTVFEPIGCSVQTVHLSCVDINTISKRTETRFYLTCIT
jgi:hypothetical protein